jgi:hypothetical protein
MLRRRDERQACAIPSHSVEVCVQVSVNHNRRRNVGCKALWPSFIVLNISMHKTAQSDDVYCLSKCVEF